MKKKDIIISVLAIMQYNLFCKKEDEKIGIYFEGDVSKWIPIAVDLLHEKDHEGNTGFIYARKEGWIGQTAGNIWHQVDTAKFPNIIKSVSVAYEIIFTEDIQAKN